MDIAAMSTILSQAKVQQQASISVMKMAMNGTETSSEMMTQMITGSTRVMEQSINPHLGGNIDLKL